LNLNNIYTLFGFTIPVWLLLTAAFVCSFLIAYFSIPTIVKISRHRKLFDIPNDRTSHNNEVPVLGGLALFAGFTIASTIFSLPGGSSDIRFILGGLIILFLLGLKDDILMLDPRKKILGQITAASIVVILGNIRITNFHSVLGITSIDYLPGVLFTIFLFLVLINGFNLIDGVDGLSSGVGIIACLAYGLWFLLTDHYNDAILCASLAGSLIAYIRYNVWGGRNKIFMGDTGAMIIGLIMAVLTTRFLELEESAGPAFRFISAPAIAFGLLFIPLFDTLRVVIIRIINGKSPFKADRLHIHHLLLRFGISHLSVSVILIAASLFILTLIFFIQPVGGLLAMIIALILSSIVSFIIGLVIKKKESSGNH
jgi:UDP-N-acetylmuramyl pentapeptide phosphotransferase/UDP-N-acetylglucosamine-1-phosphate transferase